MVCTLAVKYHGNRSRACFAMKLSMSANILSTDVAMRDDVPRWSFLAAASWRVSRCVLAVGKVRDLPRDLMEGR